MSVSVKSIRFPLRRKKYCNVSLNAVYQLVKYSSTLLLHPPFPTLSMCFIYIVLIKAFKHQLMINRHIALILVRSVCAVTLPAPTYVYGHKSISQVDALQGNLFSLSSKLSKRKIANFYYTFSVMKISNKNSAIAQQVFLLFLSKRSRKFCLCKQ